MRDLRGKLPPYLNLTKKSPISPGTTPDVAEGGETGASKLGASYRSIEQGLRERPVKRKKSCGKRNFSISRNFFYYSMLYLTISHLI
jgi:hypothetical protein